MMKIIQFPERNSWELLLRRPVADASVLNKTVQEILDAVLKDGDMALQKLTRQFDGVALQHIAVTQEEIAAADSQLSMELKEAIELAAKNIRLFHSSQINKESIIETMPGVQCWRKSVGIEKVGLYIPGGSAPLFSTILMLGIPAHLAACKEVIICSPPDKNGELHPAILYAARLVGVSKIYKVGGVQAIAAMAYGTDTVPKVHKIFGPGNQYVTCAKQLVQQQGIAIDMPAGPSEVCIIADGTAVPAYVAADLLSQAEHGADSQVLLVCTPDFDRDALQQSLNEQLAQLPRKVMASKALENSKAIVLSDINTAIDMVNEYAAEHLIISCANAETIADKIVNAGSVFLGNYSPESAGDYASGTNHTLPTNGFAKAYSGVSVDSFVKKITFQRITEKGIHQLGRAVIDMARAEGLDAHANAVALRLKSQTP